MRNSRVERLKLAYDAHRSQRSNGFGREGGGEANEHPGDGLTSGEGLTIPNSAKINRWF